MNDSLRALLRPELAELESYVPADPPGIEVRLDANEAPAPTREHEAIREAVAEAVARTPLHRYPDARATELKAAIAARTGGKPEEMLIGTGSDEVIALVVTRSRGRGRGCRRRRRSRPRRRSSCTA